MEYALGEHGVLNGSAIDSHQGIFGDSCPVPGRTGIAEPSTCRIPAEFIRVTG